MNHLESFFSRLSSNARVDPRLAAAKHAINQASQQALSASNTAENKSSVGSPNDTPLLNASTLTQLLTKKPNLTATVVSSQRLTTEQIKALSNTNPTALASLTSANAKSSPTLPTVPTLAGLVKPDARVNRAAIDKAESVNHGPAKSLINKPSVQASVSTSTQTIFGNKLTINNQTLISLSTSPMRPGERIQLAPERLTQTNVTVGIGSQKTSESGLSYSAQTKQTKASEAQSLASVLLPTRVRATAVTTNETALTSALNVLRQSLPTQRPVSQLLNALDTLMASPNIRQSLPERAIQLSQQLVEQPVITSQVAKQPSLLKTAIQQNGTLFESQLSNIKFLNNTPNQRILIEKLTQALQLSQGGLEHTTPLKPSPALLSELLPLVSQLTGQPLPLSANAKDSFLWILAALNIHLPKAAQDSTNTGRQLSVKLQEQIAKLAQASIAKIQVDQLKSLGVDKGLLEVGTQATQIEIPLRWHEHILPLTLTIQQRENEQDEPEKQDDQKRKDRQWQVMMSIELPEEGALHVQVSLIDQQCTALLWAESSQLYFKAQQSLSELKTTLERQGLTVESLECFEGKPHNDEMSFNYQLVDIKT